MSQVRPYGRGGRPYHLVVLRHGESEWNARNLFTGWVDVPLTQGGEREAARAGQLLGEHGLLPGFVHTSLQRRAIRTADLALARCDRDWIPVRRSWRLNSNHYGALQGLDKDRVLAEYGEQQFMAWRRSYHAPPPPLDPDAEYSQFADARYAMLPPEARPRSESLSDVLGRLLPYWYDAIVPDLRTGACVLVASHGNTLRALIKHLDLVPDEQVPGLSVPNGIPLAYELDLSLRPVTSGGRYLEPGLTTPGAAPGSSILTTAPPPGELPAVARPP
jgi:2,3-bisphosphoglycerate-dependent phosphoglycerate mutase